MNLTRRSLFSKALVAPLVAGVEVPKKAAEMVTGFDQSFAHEGGKSVLVWYNSRTGMRSINCGECGDVLKVVSEKEYEERVQAVLKKLYPEIQ